MDTPNSPETQEPTDGGTQAGRQKPKTPFNADLHARTIEAIKGIPADKRNAVRDEALRRVLRIVGLPFSYKAIFARVILAIWWKDGRCLDASQRFAEACGIPKGLRTVERAFAEFCRRGWVTRRERPLKGGALQTSETTMPLLAQVWTEMQAQQEGVPSAVTVPTVTSVTHSSVLSPCRLEEVDRESAPSEGLALRANLSSGSRPSDDFCRENLQRLTKGDTGKALASGLRRNARGLGLFLQAMAEENGTTPECVVEILERRLTNIQVAGKPVEGEAEMNWFADPDELYAASGGWIETWSYFAGHVADEVERLRWHGRAADAADA